MRIERVTEKDRSLLSELMQEYLHELSDFYDLSKDEQGRYLYRWFDSYFTSDHRQAYLFYVQDEVIGFAMINHHCFIDRPADWCLSEFYVCSFCQGKGYGTKAMKLLLKQMPGTWQLKYSLSNTKAVHFWDKLAKEYSSQVLALNEDEKVLILISSRS